MNIFKRVTLYLLVLSLTFVFVGCSLIAPAPNDAQENTDNDAFARLNERYFSLEDKEYQLPLKVNALLEDGWEVFTVQDNMLAYAIMEDGTTPELDIGSISPTNDIGVTFSKNGKIFDAQALNLTSYLNIPLEDCYIVNIYINKDNVNANSASVTFPGGVTIDSTTDYIVKAYGEADYFSFGKFNDTLAYQDKNDNNLFTFNITKDTEVPIYSISFFAYSDINGYGNIMRVKPDLSSVVTPDYISAYIPPTAQSDDIEDFIIDIEGDLYQLPFPAKQILDNDWTLDMEKSYMYNMLSTTDYSFLTSNQEASLVFVNSNGSYVLTTIANHDPNPQPLENCLIQSINFEYSIADNKAPFKFEIAKGITQDSTFEEVAIATVGKLVASDSYIRFAEEVDNKAIYFNFITPEYFPNDTTDNLEGKLYSMYMQNPFVLVS